MYDKISIIVYWLKLNIIIPKWDFILYVVIKVLNFLTHFEIEMFNSSLLYINC